MEKIKPIKQLGQNFLQDKNLSNKIINLLGDIANKNILEIGPGMGALTDILLHKQANVIAFDKDERAILYLHEKYKDRKNITLHLMDIRNIELNDFYDKNTKIYVIGNIPYNISTDIVFWIFDNFNFIDKAVLTMQREVAERLIAKPHTKNYGITTVAMQLFGNAKIAFHIPPTAFFPRPKVTSSVLTIDFQNFDKYKDVNKKGVIEFVRAAFSQRRKILNNSLKNYLYLKNIDPVRLQELTANQSIDFLSRRAEELTVDDFILFYDIANNLELN